MSLFISMDVAKLGGNKPSLSVPRTVCGDVPCKSKGCYGAKGNFNRQNVKATYQGNLDLYLSDPDKFENDLVDWINNGDVIYKFFRWFVVGDIVDYGFLVRMINVAKRCPQTNFLAFTKKFSLVNVYLDIHEEMPENLHFIFSGWDKNFKVDNPHNLPTAYVLFKDASKNSDDIREDAIICNGSCVGCSGCWQLVKGQQVLFHEH